MIPKLLLRLFLLGTKAKVTAAKIEHYAVHGELKKFITYTVENEAGYVYGNIRLSLRNLWQTRQVLRHDVSGGLGFFKYVQSVFAKAREWEKKQ